VSPRQFRLDFEEVPVLVNAFRRMVRGLEFDVTEMAITTYMCARAYGKPFTALPIFLVRGFHHGAIAVNTNAGIRHPKDLEGRRVGVNRGYTVTTGVWARGILHDEYGVDLDRITWVLSGDEHVAEYRTPANVVPMPSGGNLADLLASGDLAAAIGVETDHPNVTQLIPDADKAGFSALATRGHYPINHLVVVKDELLAAHPDLAADLFGAFAESKNRYLAALRAGEITPLTSTDVMNERVMEITDADPLPYGIEPNRLVIEELIGHAVNQHILDERPAVDELFATGTADLVA
jgi:ABC-type nitrate/sulfonate/bicarbonate transport system substrate-binding protein